MAVNIKYRSSNPVAHGETAVKGAPLSNEEIDGNFKNMKDAVETIQGAGGAGVVGYLPAGTGAVATTVQSKLLESVSVFDFMTTEQKSDVTTNAGLVDVTDAFDKAQTASGAIFVPPGTYRLTNFRHKSGKAFFCSGAKTIIMQGNAAQPAWNITSDATYGQLIDVAIFGRPAFHGAASSTCELLRMSAATPYAIQNAEIDIRASGGYHSLKMYVTSAYEIYASRIKVTQTSSLNTGCILGGIYNQYWMHIAGAQNGVGFSDAGWNSVYTQAVTEGMQEVTGQNVTLINPTIESWVGSAQAAAMKYVGLNPTIINANIFNVPAAKAPIGLALNAGGGGPFQVIGLRILGANYPTYPMDIPTGNKGVISSADVASTFKLDQYVSDAVLKNITFSGDCSSMVTKYSQASIYAGDFEPTLNFGGASTGITYALRDGRFQRVGNVVTFSISINLSSKGSATGSATITGLPIPSRTDAFTNQQFSISTANVTFAGVPAADVGSASSAITLVAYVSGGYANGLTDFNFANNSTLRITGSYITD